ncbi:hypothetical protein [Ktedonosporobacter rubrisoli]|nr:hypothetical protein [Ktedonosporobacter rubrisoli]
MNRPEARSLLQKMGGYLLERGRYDEAVLLLERLLTLTESTSGTDEL